MSQLANFHELSAAGTELFITADGENNQGHENSAKSLRKLRQPGAVPKMDGSYLQNDLHSFLVTGFLFDSDPYSELS